MVKKLNGNYTTILRAVSNKSWKHHPIKRSLSHKPPKLDEQDMLVTAGDVRTDS